MGRTLVEDRTELIEAGRYLTVLVKEDDEIGVVANRLLGNSEVILT